MYAKQLKTGIRQDPYCARLPLATKRLAEFGTDCDKFSVIFQQVVPFRVLSNK